MAKVKQKTKSAAKYRFKVTANNKIKRKHAFKNHILTKKGTKRKRRLTKKAIVHPTNEEPVRAMLNIGKRKA